MREYLLAKKFETGIEVTNSLVGTVPEFECREAAVYVHVSWHDWIQNMTGYERACSVAHYRTSLSLKAHIEDAADRASRRKAARASRRSGRGASGRPRASE